MDCKDKVKEIRNLTGLSRTDFCEKYKIPYQTVTDWELGHRNAPGYVLRMMEYYVLMHEERGMEECSIVK